MRFWTTAFRAGELNSHQNYNVFLSNQPSCSGMAQITIDRVCGAKASGTELLKYRQFNHIICVNICVKNICVKKCVKILTQMLTHLWIVLRNVLIS